MNNDKLYLETETKVVTEYSYEIPGHVRSVERIYQCVPVVSPDHHYVEYWDERLVSEKEEIKPYEQD